MEWYQTQRVNRYCGAWLCEYQCKSPNPGAKGLMAGIQSVKFINPSSNWLTTDSTARLLTEIVLAGCVLLSMRGDDGTAYAHPFSTSCDRATRPIVFYRPCPSLGSKLCRSRLDKRDPHDARTRAANGNLLLCDIPWDPPNGDHPDSGKEHQVNR